MIRSDLATVGERRGAIARKLVELDAVEERLQAEIAELDTTVRVLKRLGASGLAREASSLPAHYIDAEPLHWPVSRLRTLFFGDAG
jgi:hypothetical protein